MSTNFHIRPCPRNAAADHDYIAYQSLLVKAKGAKQILLGLHKGLAGAFIADGIMCGGSRVGGSGIGGIPNTQEIIDLCAKSNIQPEIEIFPAHQLNEIYSKLDASNNDGKRYVMDIANTLNGETAAKCADVPPPHLSQAKGNLGIACCCECCWLVCCCKARA